MQEFLQKTFYGNTISEWLIAVLIVAGGVILSKILYWLFSRIVKVWTKRTKTKLDDILIDMLEEPAALALVLFAMWYAMGTLTLTPLAATFMGHVFYILVVFNLAWFLVRLIDALIVEYMQPFVDKSENDLDDQLLPIVRKIIKIGIWTVAVIIGLNNAGYNIGALLAGMGIGGLALAMAAKDSVQNLFGGFTVFVDKPFVVKDRIVVDGFDGVVEEIGIRSTRLRTLAGRMVTIPNSYFTSNSIENISSEPSRKVVATLGLTYDASDTDIETALKLLAEIVDNNQQTEENRYLGFTEFGDFSLNLLLIYYIKPGEDILGTQTQINLEIMRKFRANNLEFAFPTQTIHTIKDK